MVDFRGNLDAELWHSLSISVDEAIKCLSSTLKDGRWKKAPTAWVSIARRVAALDDVPASLGTLLTDLARTLREGPLGPGELEAVLLVVGGLRWTDSEVELEETVNWLAAKAMPGDAATVVAVLGSIWYNERDISENGSRFPPCAFVLIEWLLHSGAAELRVHGRADPYGMVASSATHRDAQHLRGGDLLYRIAEACDADGRRHLLPIALRYLFSTDYIDGPQQQAAEQVWQLRAPERTSRSPSRTIHRGWLCRVLGTWRRPRACGAPRQRRASCAIIDRLVHSRALTEAGLNEGLPKAAVADAIRILRTGRHGEKGRWLPLDHGKRFPCAAAALVAELARASFDDHLTKEAVQHVLVHTAPLEVDAAIALPALHAAAHELRDIETARQRRWDVGADDPGASERAARTASIAAWTRAIARSVAPLLDHRFHDSQLTRMLSVVAGTSVEAATAITVGFADALSSDTLAGCLAREPRPNAVRVDAILVACTRRVERAPPTTKPDLTSLHAELVKLINLPWLEPIAGVDVSALLAGVDCVEISALPNERAVILDGNTLRVDERFPSDVFRQNDKERAMLGAVLYVTHELAHVAQGFAGMDVVTMARAIGAETTIMQVDLAADHIAAVMTSRLLRRVTLLDTKDFNGRGLAKFSVGDFHTEASRQRKAVRLAGSRFDLAARRFFTGREVDDGFFMLDFAPGGEHCLVYLSSNLLRLVSKPLPLAGPDRQVLVTAADGVAPFAEVLTNVDAVVTTLAELASASRLRR